MFKKFLLATLVMVPTFASAEILSMSCDKSTDRHKTGNSYSVVADTKQKFFTLDVDDNSPVKKKITNINYDEHYIEISAVGKNGDKIVMTFLNPNWNGGHNLDQQIEYYEAKSGVTITDHCYLD